MSVNQVPLIQSCVTPLNVVHHWRLEIAHNGSNQAVGQSFIVLSANVGAGSRHLPQVLRQSLLHTVYTKLLLCISYIRGSKLTQWMGVLLRAHYADF